jgi:ubiquinone/menaquinone biosynthesis C-methylase UbiE
VKIVASDEEFIRKQKEHFNDLAHKYKEDIAPHVFEYYLKVKSERVKRSLKDPASALLLDVGCGLGEQAVRVSEDVGGVVATDISSSMVKLARKNPDGGGVQYLASDATQLPFQSKSFDAAYSIGLLHHLVTESNCIKCLRECGRVVKDDGFVFVSDINSKNPLWKLILKKAKYTDVGDETVWTMPEVKRFFEEAGLEVVSLSYFGAVGNFIPKPLVPLFDFFGKVAEKSFLSPLGAHYYIVAKPKL